MRKDIFRILQLTDHLEQGIQDSDQLVDVMKKRLHDWGPDDDKSKKTELFSQYQKIHKILGHLVRAQTKVVKEIIQLEKPPFLSQKSQK